MGASWIVRQLDPEKAKEVQVVNDELFRCALLVDGTWERHAVYVPPRSQYIVTLETVDLAIEQGATFIVGDAWTNVTNETVRRQGKPVRTMKAGVFLHQFGYPKL